jgi:HK97 family phage major capsid protein/ATP-dependent Clp endopeptidase proteolytic subunit ClpP
MAAKPQTQSPGWLQIRNAEDTTQPVEILIYDQIGKDWYDNSGVQAAAFAEALKEIPFNREIVIALNSPGGNVWDGLAIYHQLKARAGKVVCRVDGVAASIASVIALAGRELQMPESAMLMIHNPYGFVMGGAEEMRKMADALDKNRDMLAQIYASKTGKGLDDIRQMMAAETWMTGTEAKANGFCDTCTEEQQMAASAAQTFDFSRFKAAPAALTARAAATNTTTQPKDTTMSNPAAAPAAGGGVATATPPAVTITAEARQGIEGEVLKRTGQILAIAAAHNVPMAEAQTAINERTSVEDFQANVLKRYKTNVQPLNLDPNIGMTKKDLKRYSVVNAIRIAAKNGGQLPTGSGIEAEAHEAATKQYASGGMTPQGFMIPNDVLCSSIGDVTNLSGEERAQVMNTVTQMRNALSANTPSTGGYLVDDTLLSGQFIDLLRNAAVVRRLGPTVLSGLTSVVRLPRQVTAGTAAWLAESAAITAADPTFGQLTLAPKRIGGGIDLSKELIMQTSLSVEAFARQELATVIAIGEDLSFINGGGGSAPLGILQTTGVGSVTFGAAPTWAKVVEFESTTETANALIGTAQWLSNPTVKGKWKTTVKVASQAVFLLEENEANGYMFNSTNQILTSGGQANRVVFGVWSDAVIGEFGGLDVVVDPYSGARSGNIQVTVNAWRDFGIRHPAAFTISSDSGAQ